MRTKAKLGMEWLKKRLRPILTSRFTAGFWLGGLLGLWVYDVANRRGLVASISDSSNLVIAGCTIFLALVAGLNYLASMRASVWAANKDALLELLRCLKVSIGQYEKYLHACNCQREREQAQPYDDGVRLERPDFSQDSTHVENLDKALFEIESVFSPILPNKLMDVIGVFRMREANIVEGRKDDALNDCEAYEMLLEASSNLQVELKQFLKDFSGIQHL